MLTVCLFAGFVGVGADEQPSLLVYAALGVPPFRSIKLRKRRATCPACGTEGDKVGKIEETDYVQFCGGARPDWEALGLLNPRDAESRITANVGSLRWYQTLLMARADDTTSLCDVQELRAIIESKPVRILDVRPKTEFGICHLPSSIRTCSHRVRTI